jgi:hypothetical protein
LAFRLSVCYYGSPNLGATPITDIMKKLFTRPRLSSSTIVCKTVFPPAMIIICVKPSTDPTTIDHKKLCDNATDHVPARENKLIPAPVATAELS